ncbi:hypothetical protein GCM10010236_57640 [Streptomyces eurythermus]|nr:hypothetical protein GCM10010236_57640 [Streptomyces eurythermus]
MRGRGAVPSAEVVLRWCEVVMPVVRGLFRRRRVVGAVRERVRPAGADPFRAGRVRVRPRSADRSASAFSRSLPVCVAQAVPPAEVPSAILLPGARNRTSRTNGDIDGARRHAIQ